MHLYVTLSGPTVHSILRSDASIQTVPMLPLSDGWLRPYVILFLYQDWRDGIAPAIRSRVAVKIARFTSGPLLVPFLPLACFPARKIVRVAAEQIPD
jgi:hypothetical protein